MKKCPFCGSDNLKEYVCTVRHIYWVKCRNCDAAGPVTKERTTDLDKGQEQARHLWDERGFEPDKKDFYKEVPGSDRAK